MTQSFYWHDYETFGADPARDRPAQFAGIRTDTNLNVIGDPLVIYCQPPEDYLPDPVACLITGITPQHARNEGLCEAEFIRQIRDVFMEPGTCAVGYNSLRFDDEVTRYTLYRNLHDPYAREWQNGNSRWDIIDMVRLTYALRPDGIEWPLRDDGTPSFRLEELTAANGIQHEAAHDALSDVHATIALARLIRDRQPRLFEFVLANKDKHSAKAMLDIAAMKPVFHVSARIPARLGCCAMVVPLAEHPGNPNAVIVYDLRQDPSALLSASVETIRRRVFTALEDLAEGEDRFPLKAVHANRCPILVPSSILRTVDPQRLAGFELDGDVLRKHLAILRDGAADLGARIREAFDQPPSAETDPDVMLYSGGFLSSQDKALLSRYVAAEPHELAGLPQNFQDGRLEEMVFRYRARNYPETLMDDEQERWEALRRSRLVHGQGGARTFERLYADLQRLARSADHQNARDQGILEDLQLYAESLIPYD